MTTLTPIVLYVEDDLSSREVMVLILREMMGCDAYHLFEDSENFMERIAALAPQPNIVLLDIHVPAHNGFEMLAMLRKDARYQRTPIVALTASVMNEEVQRLKDAGFNAVFSKPIDIDTFPEKLQRILKGENMLYLAD